MSTEATNVGLKITQHFILPALKPLILKEEGLNINKFKEYATNRNEIKIGVQLILSGRIQDLKKVEKYLVRQVDLQEKIEQRAIRTIEKELHKIQPEKALLFNIIRKSDQGKT